MRLITVVSVLMLTGGSYLLVEGGLQISKCVELGVFSTDVLKAKFWLLAPHETESGIGPNARWFLFVTGGLLLAGLGYAALRIAQR